MLICTIFLLPEHRGLLLKWKKWQMTKKLFFERRKKNKRVKVNLWQHHTEVPSCSCSWLSYAFHSRASHFSILKFIQQNVWINPPHARYFIMSWKPLLCASVCYCRCISHCSSSKTGCQEDWNVIRMWPELFDIKCQPSCSTPELSRACLFRVWCSLTGHYLKPLSNP